MACARTNEMVDESRATERPFRQKAISPPEPQPMQHPQWSGLGVLLILVSFTNRLIGFLSRIT